MLFRSRSAQEVARRISGAVAGEVRASQDLTPDNEPFLAPLPGSLRKKSTYQVPITIPISRITLFAICLLFSSPPNSPLPFYSPSLSILRLYLPLFSRLLLFARVLDCLFVVMAQNTTKLCDFTNTNNNDFLSTPIAPLANTESCEINTALLNLVMKD